MDDARSLAGGSLAEIAAVEKSRLSLIEMAGRMATVLIAVIAAQSLLGAGLTWVVPLTVIWGVALQISLARYASELQALGPFASVFHGSITGLIVALALSAIVVGPETESAVRLALTATAVFSLFALWTAAFRRNFAVPKRILIVGTDSAGQSIAAELADTPRSAFEVVGFVADAAGPPTLADLVVLGSSDDLAEIINTSQPDIVVLALDRNRPAVFAQLLDSAGAGFRVVEAAQFCEHAFGWVPVRDVGRAWFVSVLHLYQRPYSRFAKRTFDIFGASIGLVVTAPILLPVMAASALTGGPLIYRQVRVGEHGKTFTMLKLRTMRADAEVPGHPKWAIDKDPRVTRFGRLLRRFRIDELPQLWNVLIGQMSIVGPRPERPEFMSYLEETIPFWSRRQLVKPGITGWAQVRLGYTSDAEGSSGKLSYDLWYLRHRSLLVDFWICLHTIGVVATGRTVLTHRHLDGSIGTSTSGHDA